MFPFRQGIAVTWDVLVKAFSFRVSFLSKSYNLGRANEVVWMDLMGSRCMSYGSISLDGWAREKLVMILVVWREELFRHSPVDSSVDTSIEFQSFQGSIM